MPALTAEGIASLSRQSGPTGKLGPGHLGKVSFGSGLDINLVGDGNRTGGGYLPAQSGDFAKQWNLLLSVKSQRAAIAIVGIKGEILDFCSIAYRYSLELGLEQGEAAQHQSQQCDE